MAITTVRDSLNNANPADTHARCRQLYDRTNDLGFGDILNALGGRVYTRSGLTSSATQVHDQAPAYIEQVYVTAGTPLVMVNGAAAGAGEVRVEYDTTTRIPTFTFGDGAVTGYSVVGGGPLPQGIVAAMATQV